MKGGGESSEGEEDSQTVEWEAGNDGSSNKSILKNKEISAAPGNFFFDFIFVCSLSFKLCSQFKPSIINNSCGIQTVLHK